MSYLSNNIRFLRKKNNLGQDQLAKKVTRSQPTIQQWESGKRSPNMGMVQDLSNLFNVDIDALVYTDLSNLSQYLDIKNRKETLSIFKIKLLDYMKKNNKDQVDIAKATKVSMRIALQWMHGAELPTDEQLESLVNLFNTSVEDFLSSESINEVSSTEAIRIPVYNDITYKANLEENKNINGYVMVDTSYKKHAKFYGMIVNDDSMNPNMSKDDTVIVHDTTTMEGGDICIVTVGNQNAIIRKVEIKDNLIVLTATSGEYSTEIYTIKEVNELPLSVVGVVVECRKPIKPLY